MKISFDCKMVSRSLIAILFVLAGLSKIGLFGGPMFTVFQGFYSQLPGALFFLPAKLAVVAGIIVVLIEIPVSIAYALGIKKNWTGGALIAFTALTVIFFHNPFVGKFLDFSKIDFIQLIQALKNIAIIGGIMSTLDCPCATCAVERSSKHGSHHNEN
jgi:uncharacterized membrane protein YphA (DoxX/SURF4 family)